MTSDVPRTFSTGSFRAGYGGASEGGRNPKWEVTGSVLKPLFSQGQMELWRSWVVHELGFWGKRRQGD